jgi:hypothetical protein
MIIVKTNNGDCFINEEETLQVSHVKDKEQVEVWPSRWGNQQQQPQYYVIEHVEAVIYTTQETKWKDEGSEVEKLRANLESKNKEISGMLRRGRFLNQWLEIYRDAIYKINETAKKAIVGIAPEIINNIIEEAEKEYEKSQKEFNEMLEKEGEKFNLYSPACPR